MMKKRMMKKRCLTQRSLKNNLTKNPSLLFPKQGVQGALQKVIGGPAQQLPNGKVYVSRHCQYSLQPNQWLPG
eukprot:14006467-Ditylum_brightwellii.AAC.2